MVSGLNFYVTAVMPQDEVVHLKVKYTSDCPRQILCDPAEGVDVQTDSLQWPSKKDREGASLIMDQINVKRIGVKVDSTKNEQQEKD